MSRYTAAKWHAEERLEAASKWLSRNGPSPELSGIAAVKKTHPSFDTLSPEHKAAIARLFDSDPAPHFVPKAKGYGPRTFGEDQNWVKANYGRIDKDWKKRLNAHSQVAVREPDATAGRRNARTGKAT